MLSNFLVGCQKKNNTQPISDERVKVNATVPNITTYSRINIKKVKQIYQLI